MKSIWFVALVAYVGLTSAEDPLVRAIRSRTVDQLRQICTKASLDCSVDATRNELAAIVYEHAQKEVPEEHRQPLKQWPGLGDESELTSSTGAGPKPKSATPATSSKIASSFFEKLDKNRDGTLSRDEMQEMVDQTNAAARAKGIPELDLFPLIDQNKDGMLSRKEAEAYFARELGQHAQKPPRGPYDNAAQQLVKKLDADGDSMLSREEMASILDATNAEAKARGETAGDFFSTMDADSNGKVDEHEAVTFFEQMKHAGLMDPKTGAPLPKDEI
uniref:EF-hand domain-containing protein n=1 Tax=Coccolithus braarudii TaxID=221442 RepID=A0A7S0L582_9EUKA|mmetsp:Transcript_21210/g.45512  ORF Transcript_21210/g.45512 Transcript_21210/m.45512 type:complete len:275 (+) Transcript_21210:2-826(+)